MMSIDHHFMVQVVLVWSGGSPPSMCETIDHHFMVQVVLVWSGGSPPSMCETLNTLTVHKRLHMSQIGPVVNLI